MAKKAKKILTNRNGHWSKRINKKTHYFGKDYDSALMKYERERPFLEAGIEPPSGVAGATVGELLNAFLSDRLDRLEKGRFARQTYEGYEEVCDVIAATLQTETPLLILKSEHFQVLRQALEVGKSGNQLCVKTIDGRLGYARTIFRFASIDNLLIDRPLPCTRALQCISKLDLRRHKAARPKRNLTPVDIKATIKLANPQVRAMILLGINGGYNNSDIAYLELAPLVPIPDLLVFPRHKTFFMRQTFLWPETKEALKEAIETRVASTEPYLFLPKSGVPYFNSTGNNAVSKLFSRLLHRLDIYAPGKNFGALRTTFAEIGKEIGDDLALKAAMGHSDGSSLYENYASGIYVPRLQKISEHVRSWLFST